MDLDERLHIQRTYALDIPNVAYLHAWKDVIIRVEARLRIRQGVSAIWIRI